MANVGIKSSCSLLAFASQHGKMKVTNDLVNSNTGEVFKTCAFIAPDGSRVLVGFSSKLRGINALAEPKVIARQIAAMKDELQVVELANSTPEKPNYKLCNAAKDNWADVDLGL